MAENGLEDYPNLVTGASIPTQAPETAGAAKTVSVPIQEGAAGDTLPRPRRRKRLKAAPGSKLAFLEGVATDNVAAAGAIQINAPTSYGTGYIGPTEPTVVYSTNYNVSLPTADRVFKETDVIRKGCIRSEGIFLNSGEESVAPKRLESKSELELRFLVIGLFKGKNRIPDERLLRIKYPNWLFWQIWLDIIKLRGIGYFFSLKDVEGFRLYECNSPNETHKHLPTDAEEEATLTDLYWSYRSGSRYATAWVTWVHDSMNNGSLDPQHSPENGLSLEVVLGWSPVRISIVILSPIILSLAIGLWFQSRNPRDLITIQTAWGIATYVVTTGSLVAALLALLSGVGGK